MKKAKEEIEALGQGRRLLEFMVQKGVKSRSEFARIVGVSSSSINQIIWNNKEIRKDLLFKICHAFPDLDGEWLLTGNKSKLLTTQSIAGLVDIVAEDQKNYNGLQKQLEEKERYILSLEDRVQHQKEVIQSIIQPLN